MGSLLRSIGFGLTLLCVAASAAAAPQRQTGGNVIYCCEDNNGQTICGDILPTVCFGRAYREISSQGIIRRSVAAPLTPDEIARRAAEERRQRAVAAREAKQRQLDQALLETYRGVADIDARRDRALAEVDRSVETLREREKELAGREDEIKKNVESKPEGKVSASMKEDLANAEAELASHRQVIDAKLREREAIRARFDDDRRRYIDLTTKPGAEQSNP